MMNNFDRWFVYMLDNHYWWMAGSIIFIMMCFVIPLVYYIFKDKQTKELKNEILSCPKGQSI